MRNRIRKEGRRTRAGTRDEPEDWRRAAWAAYVVSQARHGAEPQARSQRYSRIGDNRLRLRNQTAGSALSPPDLCVRSTEEDEDYPSMPRLRVAVAAVASAILISGVRADEVQLVRLSDDVVSHLTTFQGARGASIGRKVNLSGWLVLNGAKFLREEFPALARHLDFDSYRQGLEIDPNSEFVTLPDYPYEMVDGQIVEGMAICPVSECRVGKQLPFRIEIESIDPE